MTKPDKLREIIFKEMIKSQTSKEGFVFDFSADKLAQSLRAEGYIHKSEIEFLPRRRLASMGKKYSKEFKRCARSKKGCVSPLSTERDCVK